MKHSLHTCNIHHKLVFNWPSQSDDCYGEKLTRPKRVLLDLFGRWVKSGIYYHRQKPVESRRNRANGALGDDQNHMETH